MSESDRLAARDIYMRHTTKDGNSYVFEHRVWDADRFLAAQSDAARQLGGKAKAEQITREQYLAERKAR